MQRFAGDFRPRYQQLVDQVVHMIETGTLRPGDKVPSVRKLRAQSGMSLSTVLHAYQILEHRGLIEARPQSGYYVRSDAPIASASPMRATVPPANARPVQITHWLTRINRDMCDVNLAPLGGAHPSRALLPIKQLNRLQAILSRVSPRGIDWYESVPARRNCAERSSVTT
ncbi:MAG: GntR family transcriptional regulator [Tepidisphaeraceae bacterium]